jgi:hypothetical protein
MSNLPRNPWSRAAGGGDRQAWGNRLSGKFNDNLTLSRASLIYINPNALGD